MTKTVRMCELVQQKKYFDEKGIDFVKIMEILEDRNVMEWAYILHDKDDTEPHYHIAMKFTSPRKMEQIAKWFDESVNRIERIKGQWKDILLYLTHKNAPSKYQYDDTLVCSNFNFNEVIERSDKNARKEEIINAIADGKIREYNIHNEISVIEFDKYKRNIENAFAYRQKILKERNNRKMECIFISGTSGSGKTTQAKRICEKKGYSYCVSGSSNDPFENYQGQDCIILDDLRANVFTFADLLKITDNHTSSMVKSRYRNKILECKLLIITSIMPISQFYQNVFESSEEPLIQFERRMQTYIRMDEDVMRFHYFDKMEQCYIQYKTIANPITKGINLSSEKEERINFLDELITDLE